MISMAGESYDEFFKHIVGRSETQLLDDDQIQNFFNEEKILVIGAGGSIGSALARRLISAKIKNVFFLDRDESALHGLALELSDTAASHSENCFIADIRDSQSIKDVIEEVIPTIVIHAAALKHLVVLERFPREGFLTNIIGTLNIAELCVELGVKQFVNISTDKAADPISVLGKTKLISEQLTAGYAEMNKGYKYVSVRFGNVFGSRGSVMQTFSKQIELGTAITITDPKVQRYFMTLEDSVHLVLQAAIQGESGDTLILKMGEPILIKDIAAKLIKASGKKIEVKFSSLRPGEKLTELLIGKDEKTLKSQGGETLRIRVDPITWADVSKIWSVNIIPNIILSSATLPSEEDLKPMIDELKSLREGFNRLPLAISNIRPGRYIYDPGTPHYMPDIAKRIYPDRKLLIIPPRRGDRLREPLKAENENLIRRGTDFIEVVSAHDNANSES